MGPVYGPSIEDAQPAQVAASRKRDWLMLAGALFVVWLLMRKK